MSNPLVLLATDRDKARNLKDRLVDRCFLATVREDGQPAVRTLVLRDVANRLAIFCNQTSPKVLQIARTDTVEILLWYDSISIQYRLRAMLAVIPAHIVHEQWHNKPEVTRKVDVLYESMPQSSELSTRRELQELVEAKTLTDFVPRSVSGFYIEPLEIERLDLNTDDGIHHRQRFALGDSQWVVQELMP